MKRAVQNIVTLGLVPVLTSTALGGTHTITTSKAGIVKLVASDQKSQCSGTVIGTRPLTVATAFHCLGDINEGNLVVVLEKEKTNIRNNLAKYTSNRVVVSAKLSQYPEYLVLQKSDASFKKTLEDLNVAQAALNADPNNEDLQENVKNLRLNAQGSYDLRAKALEALKRKALATDEVTDLAIVAFDKYDGELNQKDPEELIAAGSLIPLSPNSRLLGAKVAFGGFGITGEPEQGAPGAKGVGAFTNVVQAQGNGLLATYGMLPGTANSRIPAGEMGAILPGDSGGPLMNDYGVVGVASYIKPSPMETDRAPAAGWPRDRDGYYSYMSGRYADLSSRPAQELIATAQSSYHLNIEINQNQNLALTDIQSWNKLEQAAPIIPAPQVLAKLVLPGAH